MAVRFLAFTTAFTPPEASSTTRVVAGRPSDLSEVGMDTIFTAVPKFSTREGMKRVLWDPVRTDNLWGMSTPEFSETRLNTSAMSWVSSSGEIVATKASTSVDDRTSMVEQTVSRCFRSLCSDHFLRRVFLK